ncbi:unnamed protein product [Heterobilharzia americana]|nr:unnamed protein product [Heterobilharzia americana]
MSMSYSQPPLTLEEYFCSNSSEMTGTSLQSLPQEQKFNILPNCTSSSFKQPTLQEGLKDALSAESWSSSSAYKINKPSIKTNQPSLSSRQQLRRSNTVGASDVTKTGDGKLLLNHLTNKFTGNLSVDDLIRNAKQQGKSTTSSGLSTSTNVRNLMNDSFNLSHLDNKPTQQRFLHRAQSEHHFRGGNASSTTIVPTTTTITNNNNSSSGSNNLTTYSNLSGLERNDVPSTLRSILSQRGYNFGKSLWQQNFTPDQSEHRPTLDVGEVSTVSSLFPKNWLRRESTADENVPMNHKGYSLFKGIDNDDNNNNYNQFMTDISSQQSSSRTNTLPSSSSLNPNLPHFSSSCSTITTTLTQTITTTLTGSNSSRIPSNQYIPNELLGGKFAEDFLKKSLSSMVSNRLSNGQNEPVQLSNSFTGQTLVQWFCRQIIQSGCPWSYGLISVVCQLCNCLLQLGVLKRDSKATLNNSTTTPSCLSMSSAMPGKSFGAFNHDSVQNPNDPKRSNSFDNSSTETFQLNMDYVWSGHNEINSATANSEQCHTSQHQEQPNQWQMQQDQQICEYKTFQMAVYNHLVNLHKEFEYELDRLTREHELQLFKVRNQGVMKVCHLTDRIEALENQVEKYRILAGIEHLTKSSMLEETSQGNTKSHNSPMFSNFNYTKNQLAKVKFSLPTENLFNRLPRVSRAASEISDVSHAFQRDLSFMANIYNKPDYVQLHSSISNDDQYFSKPNFDYHNLQFHQQRKQQECSTFDAMNLRKAHEQSILQNLMQKRESFSLKEPDPLNKPKITDLGIHSCDSGLLEKETSVNNKTNELTNSPKLHRTETELEDSSVFSSEDNSQPYLKYDRTNPRYPNLRNASAPPHSKSYLNQTNSTVSNQPILGIQAKYDISKSNQNKTLKEGNERIKGVKDIKRTDKNRGLT